MIIEASISKLYTDNTTKGDRKQKTMIKSQPPTLATYDKSIQPHTSPCHISSRYTAMFKISRTRANQARQQQEFIIYKI